MNRRKRLSVISVLVLAVLVSVPVWLTWRAVRQERLNRALIAAVRQRKADAVVSLLKQGADPNARERSGGTVSIWQVFHSFFLRFRQRDKSARQEGNPALILAVETGDLHFPLYVDTHIVSALLDAGANPNCWAVDDHETPLHLAVKDCPSQVQHLLDKGADVNARDDPADTPLMYVRNPDVAGLLLSKGADVNAHNKYGHSVLAMFLDSGDSSPQTLCLLLDRGVKVNECDEGGWTPLMWAIKQGKTACARLLIDRGAKVNAQSANGETALTLAVWIAQADTVRLLLRGHANLNQRDRFGRTVYTIARIHRYRQVAALLKQAGAKE